jgi:hypothetical protein
VTLRRQKRFEANARTAARLRHSASIEDVDYHTTCGLDRAIFLKLASDDFGSVTIEARVFIKFRLSS